MAAKNKSNEISITRIYDAPVKAVWDAWTDPKKVALWWGPRGFTITTHSKDLRPGGHWNYTMHGPDGTNYENRTVYHEVEKCARLVYDHGANETQPPLFRVTALFSEIKGKTKLEMTMTLETPEKAAEIKKFIKQAGGNSTWDRLGEYLDKELKDKETFVINRTFETSMATMFKMWTDPKHFSKWLSPKGFNMELLLSEIKPGGTLFYFMSNDSGMKMYGRINYLEVKSPDRIRYTQQFTDEKNEKVTRHPMAPTWPASMLTTVTLAEEGPNSTRVTVEWEIDGAATREEIETFVAGKPGMTIGWTGSFDKLEEYLEQQ